MWTKEISKLELAAALYSEGVMSNDRIAAFLNAASSDELGLS